ncbi:MAG TPA: coproporphyrinogen III oxidase, partial [Chitinophagaceae bacterium]|nr:coproporphyrinogen III oxidase [Chitinophagaceae bacterium]
EQWLHNIHTAIALNVPHISAYALTVEPRTALDKMIEKGKVPAVDTAQQTNHFNLLM